MDKQKNQKINKQVKLHRAARRQVEIEMQLPKEHAKIWRTSKKDRTSRKQIPNTVRDW